MSSRILASLLLLVLLAACGQKGPLYVPENDAANEETATARDGASEETPGTAGEEAETDGSEDGDDGEEDDSGEEGQ